MNINSENKKVKKKKSGVVNLRKSDFHRVLLTDVLPYELPFILTNEGFYSYLNKKIKTKQ